MRPWLYNVGSLNFIRWPLLPPVFCLPSHPQCMHVSCTLTEGSQRAKMSRAAQLCHWYNSPNSILWITYGIIFWIKYYVDDFSPTSITIAFYTHWLRDASWHNPYMWNVQTWEWGSVHCSMNVSLVQHWVAVVLVTCHIKLFTIQN